MAAGAGLRREVCSLTTGSCVESIVFTAIKYFAKFRIRIKLALSLFRTVRTTTCTKKDKEKDKRSNITKSFFITHEI